MIFTLILNIYSHSENEGIISKTVFKEVETDVPPQVGYTIEDTLWNRNEKVKIGSVVINSDDGKCFVNLTAAKKTNKSHVEKFYNLAIQHHDWKDF